MRRRLASALAAVALLAMLFAAGARGAAPPPPGRHPVGPLGEPPRATRGLPPGRPARPARAPGGGGWGRARVPGFGVWCSAVAPGGRFALLRTESFAGSDLLLMALPEGRIIRGLPGPDGRQEDHSMALSADGRWALLSGSEDDAIVWDTER